ncbi:MAG: AraC family transcriptional regulator [Paraglaciecola sp.]|uniref:AraC family transcriptional regulator n=1 Tax=Paraglaciecola sp. TaxID=1920173 RepID=UPI003264FF96
MQNTLSIRSYSRQKVKHSHGFHQVVLPLRGVIHLEIDKYKGKVAPGECVVITALSLHQFTAETQARFVVADLTELPKNIATDQSSVFAINAPLLHFLSFVESQLQHQVNKELEHMCFNTLFALLGEQRQVKQIDQRLQNVIEHIDTHISDVMPIEALAQIACLSPTQFKKLFKAQLGIPPMQHVIKMRMEKAQALLIHTDSPPHIIAEQVGYSDYTAFSRRFTQHFGLPPSKISN